MNIKTLGFGLVALIIIGQIGYIEKKKETKRSMDETIQLFKQEEYLRHIRNS